MSIMFSAILSRFVASIMFSSTSLQIRVASLRKEFSNEEQILPFPGSKHREPSKNENARVDGRGTVPSHLKM